MIYAEGRKARRRQGDQRRIHAGGNQRKNQGREGRREETFHGERPNYDDKKYIESKAQNTQDQQKVNYFEALFMQRGGRYEKRADKRDFTLVSLSHPFQKAHSRTSV